MLERIRPADGTAALPCNGESAYLAMLGWTPETRINSQRLREYDAEIGALSRDLGMTGEQGKGWKPHQYLALLLTEHYLRLYFASPEQLRAALNETTGFSQELDYSLEDLRTVAIQSATGSGKTLIMHAHILQYRRLARAAGNPPNNVILVTPNEQLSVQHERELRASGIPARLFSSEAGADLLAPVEIIDLNKLADRKGVKRVAVSDFGENNLVLVDEGHLGASGKVWRERRAELARGGFTFEYSATFNQIVSKDRELRNAYAKSLLFDYSYARFHGDGYGKNYAISNLPKGAEDDNSDMYLLGCLLTFYQQIRIWRDGRAAWREFNVTAPLWVFLGKTVTGGSSRANRETRSDVARILEFLGWFLARGRQVRPMLERLLAGKSGLVDPSGNDFFAGRFPHLAQTRKNANAQKDAAVMYDDICQTVFHGPGQLHVVYLTQGEGELHLRTADNRPFGIVNIGDSAALHKLLAETEQPDLAIERDTGFARRLFADVDRPDSPVNVVIGARRFIAGWNSWRVSTMGLMHVGVGEGPEIIQMFGRGVRLKGWQTSLKRHQESGAEAPPDSGRLAELETLRIFGLRANYMQIFKDVLQAEGISAEHETIRFPTVWNFARKELKILRLRQNGSYQHCEDRVSLSALAEAGGASPPVEMDLRSQLQAVRSNGAEQDADRQTGPVKLQTHHIALFDRERIYARLLSRKQRMGWHNLAIDRQAVDALLEHDGWYQLLAPPERLMASSFAEIRELEELMVELIAELANRQWRSHRDRWEAANMEVRTLDESDPNNVTEYRLSADAANKRLIESIRAIERLLQRDDWRGPYPSPWLGIVMSDAHAYKPLLHETGKGGIAVQPAPMNGDEGKVAEQLARLARDRPSCLGDHELLLIRNLSRGRGVSFFDDHAYYPDFIVWLTDDAVQHVVFLDPKGLVRYGPNDRKKVRLHKRIKEVERQIGERAPELRLHAYVISVTPPEQIGDESRSRHEWEQRGVFYVNDDNWPEKLIGNGLGAA